MSARGWQIGAALVAAAFCASLMFGMLVPIYTDEIGWRFMTRAALDGGFDRTMSDQCGPNTIAAPPGFILPFRYLSAALNTFFATPLFVRISGVLCALAWAALLAHLIAVVSRDRLERATLALLSFGLLGLGVLPLLMVMSRPEQPVLLTATLAALIVAKAWYTDPGAHSRHKAFLRAGLVLLLGAIALAYHLKGVVYMPLFLACALLSSRGREGRVARFGVVAVLLVLTAIAAHYWVDRFRCPGDAVIAQKVAEQNIAGTLVGSASFIDIFSELGSRLNPLNYVGLIVPSDHPMSNWLPPEHVGPGRSAAWGIVIPFIWALSLLAVAGILAKPALVAVRSRKLDPALIMAGMIAAIIAVWGLSQNIRNDYEAALVLPMAVIGILFAVRAAALPSEKLRMLRSWAGLVAAAALVSQATILSIYAQPLAAFARKGGYMPDQGFSFSPFRYGRVRQEIEAAGRLCGIDRESRLNGLLVDDLTYFPYMETWRPLHRLGVISIWNGKISDPLANLRDRGSSGLIMNCAYLPQHLRARMHRSGSFCCMGQSDLAGGGIGGSAMR